MHRFTVLLFLFFLSKCALGLSQSEHNAQDAKARTRSNSATLRKVDPTDPEYQKEQEQMALEREKQTVLAKKFAEEETRIRKNETPEEHMKRLVELLACRKNDAAPEPIAEPSKSSDSLETEIKWYRTLKAFERFAEYQASSIPILVAHLDDNRASVGFRSNHYKSNTVGNACYENIAHQLQDRPQGYSRGVGYMRKGRNGEDHVTPHGESTPFNEFYEKDGLPHNDLKKWLEANKDLSYPQMQIKCLTWLLEKEKAIGAPDAESYFINILPLEIQILKRRLECGEKVQAELASLERRLKEKRADEIPHELLPEKAM